MNYSARIQTVHRETNEKYWRLIKTFQDLTGYGIIVNTSFNMHEEPIVCTPEDAIRSFQVGHLDVLAIGPFLAKNFATSISPWVVSTTSPPGCSRTPVTSVSGMISTPFPWAR